MKKSFVALDYFGIILSLINLVFFLLMRSAWIFVDITIAFPPNIPFSFTQMFTVIMILFCLFFILISVIRTFTDKENKAAPLKILLFIFLSLELIILALNIYLYLQMGNTKSEVFRHLILNIPFIGAVIAVLYLTLLHPRTRLGQSKVFRLFIILFVITVGLLKIYDLRQVRITSGPILQAVGEDNLAVIWTTDMKSTGEVLYGPDAEHMIKAFAKEDGLVSANTRLHKVLIPVGDRNGLVYQVSSTKINNVFQNNVEFGNTVKSPVISYQAVSSSNDLSFYVLNDVHSNTQIYKDFLSGKKYDFLVTNGDVLDSVESFDVIVKKFLAPVGKYNNNNLTFFVRGNHEARGEEAGKLKDYLALPTDSYYYTFTAGPVFAIVLDSGEDKLDNHMEYSGLVDFESYKKEETQWLESVLQSDGYKAAKYHIVFIHSPLNNYADQTESDYLKTTETTWRTMLSDAGIDAAFSGHTHEAQLLEPADYGAAFPTVIAGGDAWEEKDYLAVRTDITAEQMIIYYEDINGSRQEVLRIAAKD